MGLTKWRVTWISQRTWRRWWGALSAWGNPNLRFRCGEKRPLTNQDRLCRLRMDDQLGNGVPLSIAGVRGIIGPNRPYLSIPVVAILNWKVLASWPTSIPFHPFSVQVHQSSVSGALRAISKSKLSWPEPNSEWPESSNVAITAGTIYRVLQGCHS